MPKACPLTSLLLLLAATDAPQGRDVVRCELQRTFTQGGGVSMAAAFSPDGALLATGGMLGDVILWDLRTQQRHWQQRPGDHWIGTIAFSPDGRRVAVKGRNLTLHDTGNGKEVLRRDDTGPHGFCWRDDGRRIAFAHRGGFEVLDPDDGRVVEPLRPFEYPLPALLFARDGESVYAGDNIGRVWRQACGTTAAPELCFQHRSARAGDFHPCQALGRAGDGFVSFGWQGEIRRGEQSFTLPGPVFAAATSRDGDSFAAGGRDGLVHWWSESGAKRRELHLPAAIAALALHPDGSALFVATYEGDNRLYRAGAEAAPVALPGHDSAVSEVALSPDGAVLAMRGARCVLQPLDGSPPRQTHDCVAVAAGRTGSEILLLERDRVRAVDGRTGAQLGTRPLDHGLWRGGVATGPGGRVLAGGMPFRFVDLDSGALTALPDAADFGQLADSALAADGAFAMGTGYGIEGEGGHLLVTDATGRPTFDESSGGPVGAIDFSPDGTRLVYACCDETPTAMGPGEPRLRVRDARTFALVRELPVRVFLWRFLDDHFALVGDDQGLAIWDVGRFAAVQRLPIPNARATCLSRDRRTLVVATDRDVRVFRLTLLR